MAEPKLPPFEELLALASGYVKAERVRSMIELAVEQRCQNDGMGALILSYLMKQRGLTEMVITDATLQEYAKSNDAGAVAIETKDGQVHVTRVLRENLQKVKEEAGVAAKSVMTDEELIDKIIKQGGILKPGVA